MRAVDFALIAGLLSSLAGCASLSPEQAAREALMLEAARECKSRFTTIQSIERVDNYGRVWFTYRGSGGENQAFLACYESLLREKTKGILLISTGRIPVREGAPSRTTVPIQIAGGSIVVPVTINESEHGRLILDTGSTSTILSPALARKVGIEVPFNAPQRIVTLVGGKTITLRYARARSLKVGDLAVEDLDVGVFEALPGRTGADGLLGADFLQHFRVTVDRGSRQLTLEVSQR
jgi:hypothetical protein